MEMIGLGIIIFSILWFKNEKDKRDLEQINMEIKHNIKIEEE